MRAITFTTLESVHLSNGSLLELARAGRQYRVMLAIPVFGVAPEIQGGLNKAQAYMVYTDYLRSDVLELD